MFFIFYVLLVYFLSDPSIYGNENQLPSMGSD